MKGKNDGQPGLSEIPPRARMLENTGRLDSRHSSAAVYCLNCAALCIYRVKHGSSRTYLSEKRKTCSVSQFRSPTCGNFPLSTT